MTNEQLFLAKAVADFLFLEPKKTKDESGCGKETYISVPKTIYFWGQKEEECGYEAAIKGQVEI